MQRVNTSREECNVNHFQRGDSSGSKGRFERERIEQAKRIMKPFFLRRLKCDVLKVKDWSFLEPALSFLLILESSNRSRQGCPVGNIFDRH